MPVLLCNVLPNVTDMSHGAWRRLVSINFPTLFTADKITKPCEKVCDPDIDTNTYPAADCTIRCDCDAATKCNLDQLGPGCWPARCQLVARAETGESRNESVTAVGGGVGGACRPGANLARSDPIA